MSSPVPDLRINTLFNVKGQVALVTGGGSGIGLMIATALVRNGAKVYISSRKEKVLKKVAQGLNDLGPGTCHYVVSDLSSRAGCDSLASHINSHESTLHILINNSGADWGGPWSDFPEASGWDRVMNLNVKALFYLTSALTPLLVKGKTNENPGRVINISSTASLDPRVEMKGMAGEGYGPWSYAVSKAAVNHLTRIQAVALASKFVTVNGILPGAFPSRMTNMGLKIYGDQMRAAQPTGRIGEPSDIGGTVLFLAGRAGAHVTGALIPLDGGAQISGSSGFDLDVGEEKAGALYTGAKSKL